MRARLAVLLAVSLLLPLTACSRCSARPSAVAAVDIPGLPGYPGATELEHETRGGHWGYHHGSVGRRMATSAPLAEVRAFYERTIVDQGWTVILATERHGTFHWHLFRGSSLADIELAPRPAGGVEIHLDRHDH